MLNDTAVKQRNMGFIIRLFNSAVLFAEMNRLG